MFSFPFFPVWAIPGLITELSPAPHTGARPGGAGKGSCQQTSPGTCYSNLTAGTASGSFRSTWKWELGICTSRNERILQSRGATAASQAKHKTPLTPPCWEQPPHQGVFTNQRWHLVSHQPLSRKLRWDSAFLTPHPAAEREINFHKGMITCQTSIRSRRQLWAEVFMGNARRFLWFLAFKGSKVQMLAWNQRQNILKNCNMQISDY